MRSPDRPAVGDAEAPLSGVRREITREDSPPPVEPLQQEIAELEEHVKSLQQELRLEKACQARRLVTELASVGENPGGFGNGAHNGHRGDGGKRDGSLLSPGSADEPGEPGHHPREG